MSKESSAFSMAFYDCVIFTVRLDLQDTQYSVNVDPEDTWFSLRQDSQDTWYSLEPGWKMRFNASLDTESVAFCHKHKIASRECIFFIHSKL